MLGQALARQIANEITDVIGHNVLMTDESGIVIGSGDETRIGQFHEASVEVVRTRRTIAHSAEDVRDLVGTLPGSHSADHRRLGGRHDRALGLAR